MVRLHQPKNLIIEEDQLITLEAVS
jgi:hypothetical protein